MSLIGLNSVEQIYANFTYTANRARMKNKKIVASFLVTVQLSFLVLGVVGQDATKVNMQLPQIDSSIASFDNEKAIGFQLGRFFNNRWPQYQFESTIEDEKPIFFSDVKSSFVENCNPCHNGSGQAPFSFVTYSGIRKRSKSIRETLASKIMPPWPSRIEGGIYCNEQTLTDEVRSKLITWIDQGCLLKNDTSEDERTIPKLALIDTTTIRITTTNTYTLKTDGDVYMSTVYDPKLDKDTFVNAIEFESTAAEMVHHYTLWMDTIGMVSDDFTTWKSNELMFNREDLVAIDCWTKGIRPVKFNDGFAYRIPKGAKFLVDTHYSGYGHKGRSEKADLILHVSDRPEQIINWKVLSNDDLVLPPNEITTYSVIERVDSSMTLLGIFPHVHYIGRTIDVFAIQPDGQKNQLVYIQDWDYMLQTKYMFNKPVYLPVGTTLVMNAVYDNTDQNPEQPNHPVKEVRWGQSGKDEMMVLTLYYVRDQIEYHDQCTTRLVK